MQSAGPSVQPSRQKKGAKRPMGEPKKVLNLDAIEGEYLVEFEVIPDIERHVRWGYVTGDQRRSVLRAVRNRDLTASGLFAALDLSVHRPHISACLEFIQSAVIVDPREGVSALDFPMEATVRGRTVRLDTALVRAAFVLPAASMEIKRQVRHSLIVDWFREYERNEKRYIARTCLHREWASALECISMVLLASHRPRCIPGRLVYYIKHFKLDPEDDPKDRLDFAELMVQSLRREVLAVRGHLEGDTPERYMETFVAIPLTWILIHLGVCTLWGGDGVETVHPRKNLTDGTKLKSFRRLYDHGICLRDVLLVDTSPERNSLNDPYSAVHPKTMDKFPSVPKSSAWLLRFTDWLVMWSESLLPTVEFVRSYRHTVGHPQTVSQESPAEEAPAERAAPIEEATRVEEAPAEEAAPVEEVTCVEEAPAEGLTHE
ncbi:hypothetical protein R1sor_024562 [Riccia sorocarpa]|uniref:Uncharacterized protein n=1 Tax=Riccia sorocarpa TaxID=122646 RepID=A0ABD3GSE7_9MARC